jgi:hypothetical protein
MFFQRRWLVPGSPSNDSSAHAIKKRARYRKADMNRKEAIAEYKTRKTPRGTFMVRFADNGPVWVDATPDLDAARNGLVFTMRNGLHRNKDLQAEWDRQGEAAFRYEVLEKLEDDLAPMAWGDLLKEKKKEWVERLRARKVTP